MRCVMLRNDGIFLEQYDELYEKLVPESNKLRKLIELSDFSFIHDELKENYCMDNGRNATSPILLFKYLILKVIYGLSDVDVVERTQYDLSFKYFLGLNPMETNLIHPATLTKFRRKRLKDTELLTQLLGESIKIARKHDVITSTTIIVDATHTGAKYNFKSPREVLIDESKKLRKAVYSLKPEYKERFPKKPIGGILEEHIEYCEALCNAIEQDESLKAMPAVGEKHNYLKELLEDNLEQLKHSHDEDAKVGHKSADTNFYGYKSHIAINEERLVTAAVITSGEKTDGKYLQELIEQSKANGVEVKEVLGDGAYSELDNLEYAKANEITLISKLSKTVLSGSGNNELRRQFSYNKDADLYVCPQGHMAQRKTKITIKAQGKEYPNITYYFDVEKCKRCSARDGCYREGAKFKTFSIAQKKDEFKEHMKFMESEEFKTRAKERYKIEAINAHLKNDYGYRTATSRGLFGMELQAATTLFISNMERILKLIEQR